MKLIFWIYFKEMKTSPLKRSTNENTVQKASGIERHFLKKKTHIFIDICQKRLHQLDLHVEFHVFVLLVAVCPEEIETLSE